LSFISSDDNKGMDTDFEEITVQMKTISGERLFRRIKEITSQELKVIKRGLYEIMTY
jgi:hypothetical protein